MKIINVTMFADVTGLLANYALSGSSTTVIEGFDKYIYFLTDWSDVNFGASYGVRAYGERVDEGGSFLDVKADAGDLLRFRAAGLSLGFEYQCFIHPFKFGAPAIVSDAQPVATSKSLAVRMLDGKIVADQVEDYYLEAQVKGPGHVSYRVTFSVFDSNAVRVAILTLDPNIEIPGSNRYALG